MNGNGNIKKISSAAAVQLPPCEDFKVFWADSMTHIQARDCDGVLIPFFSSGSGDIFLTSYADLLISIGANSLVAGAVYCITDFQSRQEIPNTAPVIQVGVIEQLCVIAISDNTLSTAAYSLDFPDDMIIYDHADVSYGADKGRILYRKDTINILETYFDFRNFLFRRWEDAPASGIFIVVLDNGNAFQDTPCFGATSFNCSIGGGVQIFGGPFQTNSVIGVSVNNAEIKGNATNITILDNSAQIVVGSQTNLVVIRETVGRVIIGDGANNIDIFDFSSAIVIDALATLLTLGDIAAGVTNIKIGQSTSTISIDGNCRDIEIGAGCFTGSFSGICRRINIDNGCVNFAITDSDDITMGAGANLCTITDARNVTIDSGVLSHLINPLNIASSFKNGKAFINMHLIWDFATDGGAVGTLNLAQLPIQSVVVFGRVMANGLAGAGAEISYGIEVDDPLGLLVSTSILAAPFLGQLGALIPSYTTPTMSPQSGTTAANRNIEMNINVAPITAGFIAIFLDVYIG